MPSRLVLGDSIPRRGNFLGRLLGRVTMGLARWRTEGQIPNEPKLIAIVAPHTSNWDFVLGLSVVFNYGIDAHWIGKHTLFRWPMGWMMRLFGGMPVDRRAERGTVAQVAELFGERETLFLGVAPEGTRRNVENWKTGFYHIAREAGVPIVPVALDYSRRCFEFGKSFIPTGNLEADLPIIQEFFRSARGRKSAGKHDAGSPGTAVR